MDIKEKFDLISIGGGAAGLVSSSFAAGLGLKVALVSDGLPGGECLWSGCVPSKALIHRARVARIIKEEDIESDSDDTFKTAMEHMYSSRSSVSHHDSVETVESGGVKVIIGRARFLDANTIKVENDIFYSKKFIICAGGFQSELPVEGLRESGYLTHESILELHECPEKLLIIGGGPVGVEYAQTMLRLGAAVTIIEAGPALLGREEPEVSEFVSNKLRDEGCEVLLKAKLQRVTKASDTKRHCILSTDQGEVEVSCSHVFLATGKTPNTRDLNPDAAGVALRTDGYIRINESMRTTAKNIWACGDITGTYQFTHYADHSARVAVMNACLGLPIRRETRVVPWCTFFDPEIAHVGLTEKQAIESLGKENVHILKFDLGDYDRAILDGAAEGFIKAVINKNGTILGVSIVGERAGELIHEFAFAMKHKHSVQSLSGLIHVYPTMSGAIRNLSNLYFRQVMGNSWQSTLVKRWARILSCKH